MASAILTDGGRAGAGQVCPNQRQPGFTGSALVEFLYTDADPEPVLSVPANVETNPHECPRRNTKGQQQLDTFLRTGVIEHTCDGICTATLADDC